MEKVISIIFLKIFFTTKKLIKTFEQKFKSIDQQF